MKTRIITVAAVVAALAAGFGLGLGADAVAAAAPATKVVGLGSPAADIIAAEGHPRSISYGPDSQTWYFAEKGGAVRARYELNQGLVVRIRQMR